MVFGSECAVAIVPTIGVWVSGICGVFSLESFCDTDSSLAENVHWEAGKKDWRGVCYTDVAGGKYVCRFTQQRMSIVQ